MRRCLCYYSEEQFPRLNNPASFNQVCGIYTLVLTLHKVKDYLKQYTYKHIHTCDENKHKFEDHQIHLSSCFLLRSSIRRTHVVANQKRACDFSIRTYPFHVESMLVHFQMCSHVSIFPVVFSVLLQWFLLSVLHLYMFFGQLMLNFALPGHFKMEVTTTEIL